MLAYVYLCLYTNAILSVRKVFGIQLVDLVDAFEDFKIKKDTPTLIYT